MPERKLMRCVTCDSPTNIIDSRKYHDPKENFDFVNRRRLCKSCGHKFTTIEVTEDTWINILNQSGEVDSNEQ
jgi:transcriptional regulator NrdR family protein